jgi:hypothetical protein
MFVAGEQVLGFGLDGAGVVEVLGLAAVVAGEDVVECASPQQRRCTARVGSRACFGARDEFRGPVSAGEGVGVDDDHGRASCSMASMSRALCVCKSHRRRSLAKIVFIVPN